jgi:hypothetical protein
VVDVAGTKLSAADYGVIETTPDERCRSASAVFTTAPLANRAVSARPGGF